MNGSVAALGAIERTMADCVRRLDEEAANVAHCVRRAQSAREAEVLRHIAGVIRAEVALLAAGRAHLVTVQVELARRPS